MSMEAVAHARSLAHEGKSDEAIAVFEKAVSASTDPEAKTDLLLQLAEFSWQLEKKEHALRCYDAALAIVKELGDTVGHMLLYSLDVKRL